MKSREAKKEVKKGKSDRAGYKPLSDYQKEKQSKREKGMSLIPKT